MGYKLNEFSNEPPNWQRFDMNSVVDLSSGPSTHIMYIQKSQQLINRISSTSQAYQSHDLSRTQQQLEHILNTLELIPIVQALLW